MPKVFIPNTGSRGDFEPVAKMFWDAGFRDVKVGSVGEFDPLDGYDLVCFTGGSDVSPHLYGEENTSSWCDPLRDELETQLFEEVAMSNVPTVGICRGGQFLNVMMGGKMIQHIDNHSGMIMTTAGLMHEDHHQGMVPASSGVVLARDSSDDNPEIIYYEDTRCLCFQAHPEWGHKGTMDTFFELLDVYIGV